MTTRFTHHKAGSILGATMLAAAYTIAKPTVAYGQSTAPSSDPSPTLQEVVVTGSLFKTQNVPVSPTTVISATQIQEEGVTTISDVVRSISADNSGTIPSNFGGFAAGGTGVALRGLTVNSTVVLIDGLRTASYPLADDGERSFVDLNTIPENPVQRVEVLEDGASSTYGADAIGGVVNIIMRPTYVGEEANLETGVAEHGGGVKLRFTGLAGVGDLESDRYNAYLSFEYEHDGRIRVGQRGFPFDSKDYTSLGGVNNWAGQPGNFSGSIYGSVTPLNATTLQPIGGAQILRPGGCGPLGVRKSTVNGNGFTDVYCIQNDMLYADDQPEQTRYGLYGRVTVNINPATTAYVNVSYNQTQETIDNPPPQIEASTPVNTNSITLPATLNNGSLNPNDPFAAAGEPAQINYMFGDIPAFTMEVDHVLRSVMDLNGTAFGWDYDAAGDVSHNWLNTTNAGLLNYPALVQDINSGAYSFIDPSTNSQAVLEGIAPPLVKTSTSDLDMIQLTANRRVASINGRPLKVGLGAAFRYEAIYDPNLNSNLEALNENIAYTSGSRTVASAFGEIYVPLAKQVDVDLGGRFDRYSDFGSNFSPKVAMKWTPIRQLALRGTYSLGFRAPSFPENAASAGEGFLTYTANTDANFVAAHHGDSYVNNTYSLGEQAQGNSAVKPEKSRGFTFGAVVQPIESLSVDLDYYYVKKTGVIVQANPTEALAAYYSAGGGSAGLAAIPPGYSIVLDAPDPSYPGAPARPAVIGAGFINANSLVTDGLDIEVSIHHTLPWNILFSSDFSATDILEWKYSQPGSPTLNYVGTQSPYILSSGAGTPRWHAHWINSFTKGGFNIAATVSFVSALKMYTLDIFGNGGPCAATAFDGLPTGDCTTGSFTDVDLHGSYDVTRHFQLYADIRNVLDRSPSFDPIDYSGVNFNPTYQEAGIVGRYFQFGVRAKF